MTRISKVNLCTEHKKVDRPVPGEIVVNTVHEEVHRQSHGMVGEQVEDVLEDGPHDVAQEECRDCVYERNTGDATSDKCLEGVQQDQR